MPELQRLGGKVAVSNARGVKLQGYDEFTNWPYRGGPPESERPVPGKGQIVQLGLDEKGNIVAIYDKDGKPLAAGEQAAAPGGGGYQPNTPEDKWRMTLLSSLSSAAELVPSLVSEDGKVGELNASEATWRLAVRWAKQVWAEPIPPGPGKPAGNGNGHAPPQAGDGK